MSTITKLYPLLKDIGLDDKKSQEFIEIIEDSYHSEIEQENRKLVTNETFLTETTKLREEMGKIREEMTKIRGDSREEMAKFRGDSREEMAKFRGDSRGEMARLREEMANMKVELIKWNVGTIIAVAGVVAAITKLIG